MGRAPGVGMMRLLAVAVALCALAIAGADGDPMARLVRPFPPPQARALLQAGYQDQDLYDYIRMPEDDTTLEKVQGLLDRGADANACCDIFGYSVLHEAARHDADVAALALVRAGAAVDVQASNGDTPLHVAAEEDAAKVAAVLLEAKAEVDIRNNYGETPLHVATRFGHANVTKVLLKYGADEEAEDNDGETPLTVACGNCTEDGDEIATLLETDPDMACDRHPYVASLRDNVNRHQCAGVLIKPTWVLTAAHCVDPGSALSATPRVVLGDCHTKGDSSDIEIMVPKSTFIFGAWNGLLQDGNDIALLQLATESARQPIPLPPPDAHTPIDSMPRDQFFVTVDYGEAAEGGAGAAPLLQDLDTMMVANEACGSAEQWGPSVIKDTMTCAHGLENVQVNCKGGTGGYPLLVAFAPNGDVSKGVPQADVLEAIASFGDKNSTCGETPLPGVYTRVANYLEWIRRVVDSDGKDAEPIGKKEQKQLDKKLSAAAVERNLPKMREALDAGADPNSLDDEGTTILHFSAYLGFLDVARTMIAAGADVDQVVEFDGVTPLYLASQRNNPEVAAALIDAGADLDIASNRKATPLFIAAHKGLLGMVRLLVEAGADLELSDDQGVTPLAAAAAKRHAPVVTALLNASADPNHGDVESTTPLHFAAGSRPGKASEDIVDLLIAAGADVNALSTDDAGLGATPLSYAAVYGNVRAARLLLGAGAKPGMDLGGGLTALDVVCYCLDKPRDTGRCPKGGCGRPATTKALNALLKSKM